MTSEKIMKTALFTNFSNELFRGYWDGKGRDFQAGEAQYMPDYLAKHFALGLANRELQKLGKERATSPKKPEEVPEFMAVFNQAYAPDEDVELGDGKDAVEVQIAIANKNRDQKAAKKSASPVKPEAKPAEDPWKDAAKAAPDPTKPQVILPPDFDDEGDEE